MNIKIYRRIIKGLFLLLSVYAFLNLTPNKHFMLIALSTTLFITILFRTIFCGWVCPLGTIFDLIRGLGKGIGNLSVIKPINKKYEKWVKSNRVSLDKIVTITQDTLDMSFSCGYCKLLSWALLPLKMAMNVEWLVYYIY